MNLSLSCNCPPYTPRRNFEGRDGYSYEKSYERPASSASSRAVREEPVQEEPGYTKTRHPAIANDVNLAAETKLQPEPPVTTVNLNDMLSDSVNLRMDYDREYVLACFPNL